MWRSIFCGALLLGGVLVRPAKAGWVYQFNTDDSLSWRIAGHALKLHSDSATGITVTQVGTDPVWGLQEGDSIVAVDDHPVKHVSELLEKLRASRPAAVTLHVVRGGATAALSVPAVDYGQVISPSAAASTPSPPTPPASPPPSPPAPALESGWFIYEHSTDDSLSWRIPGHELRLKSDEASGITVTQTRPESLWGLEKGDVISAVDGHPVKHVGELMTRLRASRSAAVQLQIRRGNTSMVLALAADDYGRIIAGESPEPAAPST